MRSIEESCYWMANQPYETAAPLQSHEHAALAIVGAGFTGLWTAIYLKEMSPDLDIAVLEQGMVGYGASGRNAGILGETIDHGHGLAIVHFGLEQAKKLAVIGQQNVQEMAEFFVKNDIDCDFEPTGRLFAALDPKHLELAHSTIAAAQALGIDDARLLAAEEIRAELNSPLYWGGFFAPGGGVLDPFKLAQGLKQVALKLGVRFYERTTIQKIKGGILHASEGSVKAEKIVLATDAYSHHLFPELLWRYIPLYDYIMVSEPLNRVQLEAIGWKNRQGVTDGRAFFNYYRLTRDNRILWGTSEAHYYAPNQVSPACDHSARHYEELRQSFYKHFPQLHGLQFEFQWGGPIASTTRLTPFFGTLEQGRIFYALGYTGHGIGSTRVAAKILAHMVLSRTSELLSLKMVQKKPLPYPPEPLRKVAVQMVTHALRKVDAGHQPNWLLRILDVFGIGFSS